MAHRNKHPAPRNRSLKRENLYDHMNAHLHGDGSIGYYEICDAGCVLDAKINVTKETPKETLRKKTTPTVDDLITALQGLSEAQKAMPVSLEGCDCFGKWSGQVEEFEKAILLRRQEEQS